MPPVARSKATVISSDYVAEGGQIAGVEPAVARFVARDGVALLLSGHKPHGDAPLVMRACHGAPLGPVYHCSLSCARLPTA